MKREEAKAKFVRGAEEMFEEMWEWGEEHPQANFDEIAGKLAVLRRELMERDAGGVAVATWRWEVRGGRLSRVWAGDEIEWAAHTHGDTCRREGESEANASPLSRLWAGDFSPWTNDFSC